MHLINDPYIFKTPEEYHAWLLKNHEKEKEVLVGFYKVNTDYPSIRYNEALEEALKFGWIDGIRKSIDAESYTIRFTPRKPNSIWSQVNSRKVKELIETNKMHISGLEVYNNRDLKRANLYSFEQDNIAFPKEYQEIFEANTKAWENFQKEVVSYKRPAIWWVISAKQNETQLNRLNILIENSELGNRIPLLRRPVSKLKIEN